MHSPKAGQQQEQDRKYYQHQLYVVVCGLGKAPPSTVSPPHFPQQLPLHFSYPERYTIFLINGGQAFQRVAAQVTVGHMAFHFMLFRRAQPALYIIQQLLLSGTLSGTYKYVIKIRFHNIAN
jgi:hypothetical protein